MAQIIIITREAFKEKIIKNPEGYGIVRRMRKDPELQNGHDMRLLIEELSLMLTLSDIEKELFGPEE